MSSTPRSVVALEEHQECTTNHVSHEHLSQGTTGICDT